MEFSCRLKCCLYPDVLLTSKSARIEVKSPVPRGGLQKVADRLAVRWKENGEAVFHCHCWQSLVNASNKKKRRRKAPASSRTKRSANNAALKPSSLNEPFIMECERVMIKEASKTEEIFDDEEDVKEQAKRVALLIKAAKHCVFFTGAGISTAAGLGDFRGKGGKWTEEDREKVTIDEEDVEDGPLPVKRARSVGKKNASTSKNPNPVGTQDGLDSSSEEKGDKEDDSEELDYEHLRPTFTHEAIRRLAEDDVMKYVISQNCDGLHILSAILDQDSVTQSFHNKEMASLEMVSDRWPWGTQVPALIPGP